MQTSQLFDEYKNEFIQNCDKLQALSLGNQVNPKDFDIYEKLVKSNKLLMKHISVQLCSVGSKKSKQISRELKPFKQKFRVFQKRLQIIKNERNNQTSLIDQKNDIQPTNTKMTVKQLQQNDKLSECKKLLYEMEDVSGQVTTNLKAQTEKMQRSKSRLFDTSKYIQKANSLIDIMTARQRRRQTVACMTLTGVILIIGGIKYCCY